MKIFTEKRFDELRDKIISSLWNGRQSSYLNKKDGATHIILFRNCDDAQKDIFKIFEDYR